MPRNNRLSKAVRGQRNASGGSAADGPYRLNGGPAFSKFSALTPFKPRMRAKLLYSETIALTCGAAGTFGTEKIFRLNSPYDPDLSGVGNYAALFPIMAQIYNNYRVYGVEIDVLWTDPSADGIAAGAMVQASNNGYTLAGTTPTSLDRQPTGDVRALNNTGMQTVRVSRRFQIKDIDGILPAEFLGNAGYTAAVTTNPALTPYLRLAIACFTTATPTASAQVRLTFDVEFFNRAVLTA